MRPVVSFNSLSVNTSLKENAEKHHYFIVTADDLGYSPERDRGIIDAYNKGIVTRASLLINGYSRATAVKFAKEHGLALGIHINLTEGRAVNVTEEHNTLLAEDKPFFRGKFGFREAFSRGEIHLSHIKNEVEAQITEFIKQVGYIPNHVDGHQHIHVLPEISRIIAQMMNGYSLRQVFQNAKAAKEIYGSYGIRSPSFIGVSLMGINMNVERIIHTYQKAVMNSRQAPTICELMVHPGYPCVTGYGGCGEGPDDFACSHERQHELNILCDRTLKERLNDFNVTFTS